MWPDLNTSSQVASIIGLVISVFTLVRVWNIRQAIAAQQLSRTIHQMIEDALQFPTEKAALTQTNARKVGQIIEYLDLFIISKWAFHHRHARQLLKKLRKEMESQRRTVVIRADLVALRDQVFTIH